MAATPTSDPGRCRNPKAGVSRTCHVFIFTTLSLSGANTPAAIYSTSSTARHVLPSKVSMTQHSRALSQGGREICDSYERVIC